MTSYRILDIKYLFFLFFFYYIHIIKITLIEERRRISGKRMFSNLFRVPDLRKWTVHKSSGPEKDKMVRDQGACNRLNWHTQIWFGVSFSMYMHLWYLWTNALKLYCFLCRSVVRRKGGKRWKKMKKDIHDMLSNILFLFVKKLVLLRKLLPWFLKKKTDKKSLISRDDWLLQLIGWIDNDDVVDLVWTEGDVIE